MDFSEGGMRGEIRTIDSPLITFRDVKGGSYSMDWEQSCCPPKVRESFRDAEDEVP